MSSQCSSYGIILPPLRYPVWPYRINTVIIFKISQPWVFLHFSWPTAKRTVYRFNHILWQLFKPDREKLQVNIITAAAGVILICKTSPVKSICRRS